MIFERFYDTDLAQASYLVGGASSAEAIVVDPRRDVAVYLEAAAARGLRIVAVTETHIHADYLSGSRELAAACGATLYLSGEGGPEWRYGFEGRLLHHGDVLRVGDVSLEALHTPGHTPEHLSFLITDGAASEEPVALLSGDFVFVGDVGRPDLLDEAAGGIDTRFEGSRQLFASLRDVFLKLDDDVRVWPGHGAGSACGKDLGDAPSTTVGNERRNSWWRRWLDLGDVEGFTSELLEGQVDAPSYFGRMKTQNRDGPALLGHRGAPRRFGSEELGSRLADTILLDTRPADALRTGVVPGALLVPAGGKFATYASYVFDPESDPRPIVLVAANAEAAAALRDRLAYVGIDNVVGFITSVDGLELAPLPTVAAATLAAASQEHSRGAYVLDVRTAGEFEAGHIEGAHRLHAGRVMAELDDLPRGRAIVVYCETGARATVVAAALRSQGFGPVAELEGSYVGWVGAAAARTT